MLDAREMHKWTHGSARHEDSAEQTMRCKRYTKRYTIHHKGGEELIVWKICNALEACLIGGVRFNRCGRIALASYVESSSHRDVHILFLDRIVPPHDL